jgi:sugar phosphate isomerase/epimerase
MRPLALHQMNALEVSAAELVSIAHEVGCERVCVFVHVPRHDVPFDAVTPAMVGELRARMAATGVAVANVEFFPLGEDVEIESFRAPFELGAELGAERIVTLVDDPVQARAAENLARVSDLAAEYDMQVGLEFMPMTPGCTSIHEAAELIRLADRPNAGFAVDCLHLVRSGGSAEDVAMLPAELFGYAQICDGRDLELRSDYFVETFERVVPGDGVFPITEIFNALPAWTPVEVEVPSFMAAQRGVPPLERVQRAVTAARAVLEHVRPTR